MRTTPLLLMAVVLTACGGSEEAQPAPAEGPAVADFGGTWQITATLDGVADPVPSVMSCSDDGSCTMTLPDREPMTFQVSMTGDSLVGETAEYESILRDGVMVSIRTAMVRQGDGVTGKMLASYRTDDGTELVNGTMTGTR